ADGTISPQRLGRPALLALLTATALLYLVDLAASGWGNAFYPAAVEASTRSWKAFFFGSFDSSNFITVDKPPASLWVMELSARVFGLSSWSVLVPQALEGVAAVWLLFAAVRRRFGPAAGLLAGLVLALTPVATLMFRFNNPDALLTLLLVAAAYALTRALERGSTRWLVLCAVAIGFAFLTKTLQALTIVPGFALVWLVAAPGSWWRRVRQLLVAGVALVVAGGWWVAIVQLWPAASRPYIGGSTDNSELNLIFGYNGFGRITGNETGSVVGGGGPGRAGAWGPTGIFRLFGSEMGTQISWVLPAALLFGVVLLWAWRRAPRTDGRRGAVLLWGSWLVVTGLVFSFAQGIIHPYYTVALAPAVGALVGIGASWLWQARRSGLARITAAVAVAGTAVWAFELLERTPAWQPWLRTFVLVAGLLAAAALLAPPWLVGRWGIAIAAASVVVALAAPAAYSVQTASSAYSGAIPAAGPAGASGLGRFPGGFRAFGRGGFRGGPPPQTRRGGGFGFNAPPQGGFQPGFRGGGFPGGFGRRGGLGGLLDSGTPSSALVKLLKTDASRYEWVAASVGANSAAGVQLAIDEPVLAIGGFNGTDPAPTLAQFQALVKAGKVHYFLTGGGGGFGAGPGGGFGSSRSSTAIATWVEAHFTARTVGGVSVYDLSSAS
ncbi:MAG: glycosyltransferase family 39 protein, partial [Actinobacteria bacterium]|nr:glycosyltransferase family 39 protein [Actinomycetota bacterium]